VIDISSPTDAQLVKTIEIHDFFDHEGYGIAVSDGYAFVADGDNGLKIYDVDPLDSAFVVQTIPTQYGNPAESVAVSGQFAYVACYDGLHIIKLW
jgi:hypothetical protein